MMMLYASLLLAVVIGIAVAVEYSLRPKCPQRGSRHTVCEGEWDKVEFRFCVKCDHRWDEIY